MRSLIFLFLTFLVPLSANPKLIIGISGGTGSGKSTIADQLIQSLDDNAVLIRQDDYYKDLSYMPKEERAKRNFDHPDAIDFELLQKHLLLLKNNKPIEVPLYNFCHHTREEATHTVQPAEIIILEGLLLFAVPEIRDLLDLKIFIEANDDIRLLRRMERDMKERGRDFSGIRDQYLTTVKPMHDAFIEPSKRHANVIIPTLNRNDHGVSLIIAGIKEKLENTAFRD